MRDPLGGTCPRRWRSDASAWVPRRHKAEHAGKGRSNRGPLLSSESCRRCNGLFAICASCDRGQAYCSPACRTAARQDSVRAARRRHRQSPEGRLDHRDHQRAFRARVRDQTSRRAAAPATLPATDPSPTAPLAGALRCMVCGRGEPLRAHTARLLGLLDDYGPQELAAAVTQALETDALGAGTIAHLLEQRRRQRRQPPPIRLVLPDHPGVRTLDVTPHRLESYDALTRPDPEDAE